MLPKHKSEPDEDRPAYVIDARHGTTTGMLVEGMTLALQETGAVRGPLKRRKQLECHPMEKFVDEAGAEWDAYAKLWKVENKAPNPIPPYPYNHKNVKEFMDEEMREVEAAMARYS